MPTPPQQPQQGQVMDVERARKDGVTEPEILNELVRRTGRDATGALNAGHTYADVIADFNVPRQTKPVVPNKQHFGPLGPQGNSDVDPTSLAVGMGDHFTDNATYGFGKQLLSVGKSLAQKGDLSDYSDNLQRNKNDLANENAAHPVLNRAAGAVGAVASPINKVIGGIKNPLAGGGTAGALAAAGDADWSKPVDALEQVATGAGAGALVGGAIHGVANVVSSSQSKAMQQLRSALAQGSGSLEEGVAKARAAIAELVRKGSNGQEMLMDASSPLFHAADHAATTNAVAKETIDDATRTRQMGMADRLRDFVTGKSGNIVAENEVAAAKKQLYADATKAFDTQRAAYPDLSLSKNFKQNVLAKPGMQSALDYVKYADKLDADVPGDRQIADFMKPNGAQDLNQIDPSDLGQQSEFPTSYSSLSQFGRYLNQKKASALTGKNPSPELASAYRTLRDGVNAELGDQVPAHAGLMQWYGQSKQAINAITEGHSDGVTGDPRTIAGKLAEMSKTPVVLEGYRRGATSALLEKMNRATGDQNVAKALSDDLASPATVMRLKAVFGDGATLQQFLDQAQAEAQMNRARGATTGSQSGGRIAAMGAQLGQAIDKLGAGATLTSAVFHHPTAAVGTAAAMGLRALGRQAAAGRAEALAPVVTTKGAPAINSLLDEVLRTAPGSAHAAAQARLPIAASAQAGGILAHLFAPKVNQ